MIPVHQFTNNKPRHITRQAMPIESATRSMILESMDAGMNIRLSLIDELEGAIQGGSSEKRLETLRRVTDLFLGQNEKLSERQIAVFDDVLGHLIKNVESRALAELSERLAPVENAPIYVIKRLANDDNITVASPVLTQSTRLTTGDLIEIAKTKSEEHRFAISGRAQLDDTLTMVLVEHGEKRVLHRLSSNPGVRFSDEGFAALLSKSGTEQSILEAIGLRCDLPMKVLRDLLMRASEALREKLLSVASPTLRASMQHILMQFTDAVGEEVTHQQSAARNIVHEINRRGQLNDAAVRQLAEHKWREEVAVALEMMTSSKSELVEHALGSGTPEAVLVICRAAGLKWLTARAILELNAEEVSLADLADLERAYAKLTMHTAQRTLRFWQVKGALVGKGQRAKPATACVPSSSPLCDEAPQ